ncbi:MAG TPA: ABC transporter permease [Pyrinomonadaceae bacterium]|jgi:putative ABC transport system permease protein|nr:ABC transporter permease [Pyrinomonadaceae bacterium]
MKNFWQDLRYGMRMLIKSPGFTLIAVAALALGIGANTVIFSVVNTLLLRPLPFPQSEQITAILLKDPETGSLYSSYSYPNFEDIRNQNQVFEQVAAYSLATAFLRTGDEPERMQGVSASADLFPLLGVNPLLGRTFSGEEERPGGARFIVLSYDYWQHRFGGDRQIVGQQLPISGQSVTVLGVMPRGFKFPVGAQQVDFWMPLASSLSEKARAARGAVFLNVVGRLKPGVTLEQAQAETDTIASRLETQYPDANTGFKIALVSSHERLVGKVRPALLVLLAAVVFVLLIACANVANLMLARATVRRKEIAIRTALGASRWRVVRQLLTESLLLSSLGGAAGLLLALWGMDLLVAAIPSDIPRTGEISMDKYVLVFTAGLTALTGVIFGLVPALQASRTNLDETLKDATRGMSGGMQRNRMRSVLVIAEISLSLVLLVGAGLLFQSFRRLLEVSPGFEPDKVLTAEVSVSEKKYPEKAQRAAFYHEALERIAAIPDVQSAAVVNPLPLAGNFEAYTFDIVGRPPFPPGKEPASDRRVISPGYFQTMNIPVRKGRAFVEQDRADAPPVTIINETFARRFFPGEDPVGKAIIPGEGQTGTAREIVGVVGDVRHAGLDVETSPEYYVPYEQASVGRLSIVARAGSGNPASIGPALRGAIVAMDKEQPVYNIRPMTQLLDQSVARRRFNMMLLGGFALLALLLASIGIYGVISYSVAQRTREIGIRIALGAQIGDVVRLILRQGLTLAVVGLVVGLFASFFMTRLMASLLFGVSATDPVTFASVALILLFVALLACYIPARRAARVDPNVALRYE